MPGHSQTIRQIQETEICNMSAHRIEAVVL